MRGIHRFSLFVNVFGTLCNIMWVTTVQSINCCSVTIGSMSVCTSNTCRISTTEPWITERSSPQWVQKYGWFSMIESGSLTIFSVNPLCPIWPPLDFPDFSLKERVSSIFFDFSACAASESFDVGMLLLWLFFGVS